MWAATNTPMEYQEFLRGKVEGSEDCARDLLDVIDQAKD